MHLAMVREDFDTGDTELAIFLASAFHCLLCAFELRGLIFVVLFVVSF